MNQQPFRPRIKISIRNNGKAWTECTYDAEVVNAPLGTGVPATTGVSYQGVTEYLLKAAKKAESGPVLVWGKREPSAKAKTHFRSYATSLA